MGRFIQVDPRGTNIRAYFAEPEADGGAAVPPQPASASKASRPSFKIGGLFTRTSFWAPLPLARRRPDASALPPP